MHRWARGVDIDRFSPAHADAALRAELAPDGELLVGFVGRLAPEKEVDRLAALAGVPGIRVVVVGDGPELESLREQLPDAAFLGAKYGESSPAAYASLDVFVHTGPHETFCQAVQEAMASGLPVLAPDAGGPKRPRPARPHRLPAARGPREFGAGAVAKGSTPSATPRCAPGSARKARKVVLGRTWPAVCHELVGHYEAVRGRAAPRGLTRLGAHDVPARPARRLLRPLWTDNPSRHLIAGVAGVDAGGLRPWSSAIFVRRVGSVARSSSVSAAVIVRSCAIAVCAMRPISSRPRRLSSSA